MAYVVTEPCVGTKDRACVEVCPVDCFYNNKDETINAKVGKHPARDGDTGMLVIDPDECISCGACEAECPVEAIFDEADVPPAWASYVKLNSSVTSKMTDEEREKNRVTAKS